MEGSEAFLHRLEEAVAKKRAELETQRLPQLKEGFRSLQILFENIHNLLIRKGFLRDDPYKYDQRITEIAVPADGPFTEAEKNDEVSYRLSAYRSQLDYLNNYYQFSIPFLDLGRLKRLSGLLGYIGWKSLTDTARSPTTRALAQCIGKIRLGTDSMAAGIVKDSLIQIDKTVRELASILGEIVSLHRESFKCELRKSVLPRLSLDAGAVANSRPEVQKNLKRVFAQALPGRPYFPELVDEVLAEEFGEDAETRRQALLDRLKAKEQKKEQVKIMPEVPYKEILLEAARALSHTGPDLSSALEILTDNHFLVSQRKLSFGEAIKAWLTRRMGRGEEEYVYEVEYFEGSDAAPKSEKISFMPFIEAVNKKSAFLNTLSNKAGGTYRKLEEATDDQVLDFVSKQLTELQLIHRRMNSLNTYFMAEVPREQRQRIKGLKLPLTAIRNAIVKANQRKHDFVSRKEEEEQMRRLDIH